MDSVFAIIICFYMPVYMVFSIVSSIKQGVILGDILHFSLVEIFTNFFVGRPKILNKRILVFIGMIKANVKKIKNIANNN